jgi:hypothetical protein
MRVLQVSQLKEESNEEEDEGVQRRKPPEGVWQSRYY